MTKELRDRINKKVPESLQTTDFKMMLNLIKEHNIGSVEQLKSFVITKIGTLNLELKNKQAPDNHPREDLRKIAKEIDGLISIRDQFFKFM